MGYRGRGGADRSEDADAYLFAPAAGQPRRGAALPPG